MTLEVQNPLLLSTGSCSHTTPLPPPPPPPIGAFRVAFHLCFKASPSAKPFNWKLVLFTCKLWFIHKLISIERLHTRTHFETEVKGNSVIAYCIQFHLRWLGRACSPSRLHSSQRMQLMQQSHLLQSARWKQWHSRHFLRAQHNHQTWLWPKFQHQVLQCQTPEQQNKMELKENLLGSVHGIFLLLFTLRQFF